MGIGFSELIVILIIVLLVFGPSRLPEIGRALGKTLREFRNAQRGLLEERDSDENKNVTSRKEDF